MKKISSEKLVYAFLIGLCVAILICMFFVYLFTDASSIFADIVTVLATIIGAYASIVEYKKNNSIDLCNEIITAYSKFIEVPTNKIIQYKLECLKRRNVNLFNENDITGIRNYLMFFNGVAQNMLNNNVKINKINTILGYRFFLIMNCPYIQDLEIIPNAQAYIPCIKLHNKWRLWSEKHAFKRSGDAVSLEKRFDDYNKFANM